MLLDFWRAELKAGKDPVAAWGAIVEDPERSKAYRNARGKAGWRRTSWDEATDIIAAAKVYTIKKFGPDHLASFSPIPAMSMVSFLSGHRLSNLLGGTMLSFYEWYHDLPHVMPMIWGDQTDVHEFRGLVSRGLLDRDGVQPADDADGRRALRVGAQVQRRQAGQSLARLFGCDEVRGLWVPVRPGTDTAFLMACIHVILQEFHVNRRSEYFHDYVGQYTNLPFLVILDQEGDHYASGRFLRASDLTDFADEELGEWKFPLFDKSGGLRLPGGAVGFRGRKTTGRWNSKRKMPHQRKLRTHAHSRRRRV